jgi:DNA-binding beta-propeller fold protein YncE
MGQKRWIHGLSADPMGNIWITDVGRHIVMKFDPDGKLMLTLGKADVSGESPQLFNQPTHVLVTPASEIYVTDGYGNSRVVKFSAEGKYVLSWGTRGRGQGEFDIPHCLTMDSQGLIYVADRGNDRIQVFDENGGFVAEWPGLPAPGAIARRRPRSSCRASPSWWWTTTRPTAASLKRC